MATKKSSKARQKVSKSMAKNDNAATVTSEELVYVDPARIDTVTFKNIRTGDFTKGGGAPEGKGQTHAELTESIQATGQKTPVVLRKSPDPKYDYQLIAGWRRVAAIAQLKLSTGDGWKVKGIVKPLADDLEALIENATENNREGIRPADMMLGLVRVYEGKKERGNELSDRAIAGLLGMDHGYVSDLLNIWRQAPEVAKMWHEAEYQLGVRDMRTVRKIKDKALQLAKYNELLADKTPSTDEEGEKTANANAWIERCIKQAEHAASIIGHQVRRGGIKGKGVSIIWADELEWLGVKVKADATGRQRTRIAKAAEKAYNAALEYVEPVAEEETEANDSEAA